MVKTLPLWTGMIVLGMFSPAALSQVTTTGNQTPATPQAPTNTLVPIRVQVLPGQSLLIETLPVLVNQNGALVIPGTNQPTGAFLFPGNTPLATPANLPNTVNPATATPANFPVPPSASRADVQFVVPPGSIAPSSLQPGFTQPTAQPNLQPTSTRTTNPTLPSVGAFRVIQLSSGAQPIPVPPPQAPSPSPQTVTPTTVPTVQSAPAQTVPAQAAQPTTVLLDGELQAATCAQNWRQAINIVDRAIAAAPADQATYLNQLNSYRSRLQILLASNTRLPDWSGRCTAGS